jgi:hypothetical protein
MGGQRKLLDHVRDVLRVYISSILKVREHEGRVRQHARRVRYPTLARRRGRRGEAA